MTSSDQGRLEELTSRIICEVLEEFQFPEGVPGLKEAGAQVVVKYVGRQSCNDPVFGPWTQVFSLSVRDGRDWSERDYRGKLIDALASLVCRHSDMYNKVLSFRHVWHALSGALYAKGLDPVSGTPFPEREGPPPIGLPSESRSAESEPKPRMLTVLEGFDLNYGPLRASHIFPWWAKVLYTARTRLARFLIKVLLGERDEAHDAGR